MEKNPTGRNLRPNLTRSIILVPAGLYILLVEVPTLHSYSAIGMIGAGLWCLGAPSALVLNTLSHGNAPRFIFGRYSETSETTKTHPDSGDEVNP